MISLLFASGILVTIAVIGGITMKSVETIKQYYELIEDFSLQ